MATVCALALASAVLAAPAQTVAPLTAVAASEPELPESYAASIEIHDGARGWQPGWQKGDYHEKLFSTARTAVDPSTGQNRTDESIDHNGTVYTVWRKWNKGHTEEGCQPCPTCTSTPLPRKYITEPKLVKSGVDCRLGAGECDEWTGMYQGPRSEPVAVLVAKRDVTQLVKISWEASSAGAELYIDYTHWESGKSGIHIPTNCHGR